jgi:hypothetical protein
MRNALYLCLLALLLPLLSACGGGASSSESGSSGTLSMQVTDARPSLPAGTEKVFVTFEEVSVQRADGGWILLPLVQTPYTIDLLRFADGTANPLIRPAQLEPGHYTQVRLRLVGAAIRIDGLDFPMEILPQDLQAEKNFEFEVTMNGTLDFTIDFDLTRSVTLGSNGAVLFKPIFHLVKTLEAVTVQGSLLASTFGSPPGEIEVTVFTQGGAEAYISLHLEKASSDPTPFSIRWLPPRQTYYVRLRINGIPIFLEKVEGPRLSTGAVFALNEGMPI